jgi:hypothetical protein
MVTWPKFLLGEGDAYFVINYMLLLDLSLKKIFLLPAGDILATREQSGQMLNSFIPCL